MATTLVALVHIPVLVSAVLLDMLQPTRIAAGTPPVPVALVPTEVQPDGNVGTVVVLLAKANTNFKSPVAVALNVQDVAAAEQLPVGTAIAAHPEQDKRNISVNLRIT